MADDPRTAETSPVNTAPITGWLLSQALVATSIERLMRGMRDRLEAQGLPILRLHVSTTTLHPQFDSFSLNLYREGTSEQEHYLRGTRNEEPFRNSPLFDFLERIAQEHGDRHEVPSGTEAVALERYRLMIGEGLNKFEILRSFAGMGATDYAITSCAYGDDGSLPRGMETGMLMSWLTDRPSGFRDDHLEALREVTLAFAVACRPALLLEIGHTILGTYMGRDVGGRVMSGSIVRGDVETINAAIVIADLRGFTALADRMPRDDLVHMLDDYLMCMADPVEARGGQVLKFLGDGLLAIFPVGTSSGEACEAALRAVTAARAGMVHLDDVRQGQGLPPLPFGAALHLGEILWGNIGAAERLDFTAIGPAVNLVSRLEGLCRPLGRSVLISGAVAAETARPLVSLGEHALRGIAKPCAVFTLPEG